MPALDTHRELANPTGYLHPAYAASLGEFGTPRKLTNCGGWLLERNISGSPYRDAMGCYPLFACRNWAGLPADLASLQSDVVSVALVTDPFGHYDAAHLHRWFDLVVPFKEHYVVDLETSTKSFASPHHRRNIRKALRDTSVEYCPQPSEFLRDWTNLYANVIQQHNLKGIKAFSLESFKTQLGTPGLFVFQAVREGTSIGAQMWYIHDDVAYNHLVAISDRGYELRCSFGLYATAIEYFKGKVRWLDLGGVPGVATGDQHGLARFKRGWSTGTRIAYFCGRTFHPSRSLELAALKHIGDTAYFPPYRKGEFA